MIRSRRLRGVMRLLISIAVLIGLQGIATTSGHAAGLGGGMSFDDKSAVTLSQGQSLPPVQYVWIENTGDAPAEVVFESVAPEGISVTSPTPKVTIQPKKRHQFDFGVSVAASKAPGRYTVLVQGKQINVPKQPGSDLPIAPGVGGRFEVEVTGKSANVTVNAVSENDGTPVTGDLTLAFVPTSGQPFVVRAANNVSSLSTQAAPGNYRATFEIPDLVRKDMDFTLSEGENKEVKIPMTAINFVVNGALPSPNAQDIVTVSLVASVMNNLRPITGPVTIDVLVRRDGAELETVTIQQQPILPVGLSEGRETWRPTAGWTPGTYTFAFVLKTPTFRVTSSVVPEIVVPAPFPFALVGGLAVPVVVVAVVGVWLLWVRPRRRRRASR